MSHIEIPEKMRKILISFTTCLLVAEIVFVVVRLQASDQPVAAVMTDESLAKMDLKTEENEAVPALEEPEPITIPEVELREEPAPVPIKPQKTIAPASTSPKKNTPSRKQVEKTKVVSAPKLPPAKSAESVTGSAIIAPEHYLMEAWRHVRLAQKKTDGEKEHWQRALGTIDRMITKHPQWVEAAEKQNRDAAASDDAFPFKSDKAKITMADVQPLFQKYWALYHLGTAEFIRVMAYDHLQKIAHTQNDKRAWAEFQWKKVDAADRIVSNYSYAQVFDQGGWMWQPITSLREYVDFSELTAPVVASNP